MELWNCEGRVRAFVFGFVLRASVRVRVRRHWRTGSGFLAARICSHARTAHMPSFSRTWSPPVPKDSSPQMKGVYFGESGKVSVPESIRLPKNFQPVGTCTTADVGR